MWILPKQLHTSAFVPDMAALISDLAEQSQICEQSLFQRSKPSLARTWSQKWKRDSWTQLLSGRILRPSHGPSFVTAWTSSLEVIPASHSVPQVNDSDETTLDTSGLGSQMELFPCDPESAFSRTSRDTSASDSEKSSANWKALVTRRRGEYSQRVKSAHLTNASECSSLPTAKARDWKDTMGCSLDATNPDGTHRNRRDRLVGAIVVEMHGRQFPVIPSTNGSRLESWGTPSCMDTLPARSAEALARAKLKGGCKNLREEVHQWATPRAGATDNSRPNNKGGIPLGDQARRAEQWATPRAEHDSGGHRGQKDTLHSQIKAWATPRLGGEEKAETRLARGKDIGLHGQVGAMTNSAKLNPRWVETLMGLPIGWTMPSCSSPLTIAPMNCDCSATEWSQPPQPELF